MDGSALTGSAKRPRRAAPLLSVALPVSPEELLFGGLVGGDHGAQMGDVDEDDTEPL